MKKPMVALIAFSACLAFAVFAQAPPPAATTASGQARDESYRLIRGLLRDGLDGAALEQIRAFLKDYEADSAAHEIRFHEGRILLARGDAEGAAASFSILDARHAESAYLPEGTYLWAVAEAIRGRSARSAELFEKALAFPNLDSGLRREASLRLAALKRGAGDCAGALAVLEPFKKTDDAAAALERARCHYVLRDFAPARKAFEAVLAANPDAEISREARQALGMMEYHDKRYAKAREILSPLFEESQTAELAAALAWCHYHLGDFAAAYDLIRYRDPRLGLPEHERAVLDARGALARGEDETARAALEKIVEARPDDPEALALLGHALRRLGEAERAADMLRRASRELPVMQGAALLFEAGEIHYGEMRDFKGARRVFEALASTPGHDLRADAALYAAKSALGEGDRVGALEWLTALLGEAPEAPAAEEAHYLAGELHVALGQTESALAVLEAFLQKYPNSPRAAAALLRKAEAEEKSGALAEAAASLRYFLSRHAEHADAAWAHSALARVLARAGKHGEAAEVFRALETRHADSPDAADVFHLTGRALLAQKKHAEAREAFLRDAEANPARGFAWAARAALAAGDAKTAVGDFEKAHAAAPGSDEGREAAREGAEAALAAGLSDRAAALYRKLREAGGDPLYARHAQAALEKHFLTQGKIKEALHEIPAFVLGDPASAHDAALALARARDMSKGDPARAAKEYEKITASFPGTDAAVEAEFFLGEAALARGEGALATERFLRALGGKLPEALRARAHYGLGNVAFREKRFRAAAKHFDEAAQGETLASIRPTLFYLAGTAYEQERMKEEARRRYLDFAAALPDRAAMQDEQIRAALFFQREGYAKDSLAFCEALLPHVKTDDLRAEIQFYLAENHKLIGNLDRALIEYLKVTYLHPENAMWAVTARFEAGRIYEMQGQWDEAVKLYRAIAEAAPGSTQSEAAQRRLNEIAKGGASPVPSSEMRSEDVE